MYVTLLKEDRPPLMTAMGLDTGDTLAVLEYAHREAVALGVSERLHALVLELLLFDPDDDVIWDTLIWGAHN